MTELTGSAGCLEVPSEIKTANLLKKLDDNPGMKPAALTILAECAHERQDEAELLERVQSTLKQTGDLPVQPLSAVVDLLVREGALIEELEVDGELYDGTLYEAFEDESISDDATAIIYEVITEAGTLALTESTPAKRAATLFADKPEHSEAFIRTLQLCSTEGGLATDALGRELDAEGFLHRDERTGIPGIYPSMYANFLKDAGCIEWHDAWVTTDLGRQICSAHTPAA